LCISMGMYANEKARRSEEENIEEGWFIHYWTRMRTRMRTRIWIAQTISLCHRDRRRRHRIVLLRVGILLVIVVVVAVVVVTNLNKSKNKSKSKNEWFNVYSNIDCLQSNSNSNINTTGITKLAT
jgi:hypothetical protein